MAEVSTVTAVWSGFIGSPGYSRLRFAGRLDQSGADAAGTAVRAFFDGMKAYWQIGWTVAVQPIVQVNDVGTGALTGELSMTSAPAAVGGSTPNTTSFTGGSGFVVHWITGAFSKGRKIRGRTYIVPALGVYSTDGTITPTVVTNVQALGTNLINAGGADFAIWTKTFDPADSHNQIGGTLTPVTGVVVPDRSAQLRTRRS